jgi:hypothetical protein
MNIASDMVNKWYVDSKLNTPAYWPNTTYNPKIAWDEPNWWTDEYPSNCNRTEVRRFSWISMCSQWFYAAWIIRDKDGVWDATWLVCCPLH